MTEERAAIVERANSDLKGSGVTWVYCQFTDLDGRIRSFTVPASDLLNGSLWEDGMTFDGSSVGFARTENSDLRAVPDPESLLILPYGEGVQKVARVVTDTWSPDGSGPFSMDPRNAAKRCRSHLVEMGFPRAHLQPELEFYLLKEGVKPTDIMSHEDSIYSIKPKEGYFASVPWDNSDEFRNEFTHNLINAGMDIKFHHHEGGAQQVEVEFKHVPDIVKCGDHSMLYKLLSRLTARQFGYSVSYIPKISERDSGNGMHVHMWLEGKDGSAFSDPEDEMGLSQTARYYIGGILEHARATCLFTNPTINSYKRLIPEFEAPVFATWGQRNRTAMIRIPGSPGARRVGDLEVRHSDTSCNPYLAYAVLIEAGLDGIKHKIEPPEPLTTDPNMMSREQRKGLGIEQLPGSLLEAIESAMSDDLVMQAVGKDIFGSMVDMKMKEVTEFGSHVTDWELKKYLSL
ncbi:MAG: glutamine synthetase family protein [Candidatus Thermoplasmatota archaeon]|nr:glutamine synthetase family protein [Candidatus Thermoplasmatota archaeon]